MIDESHEHQLREAWRSLQATFGPWDPAHTGDSSALINGLTLNVKVHRWLEPDGTKMAVAMCEGIELDRKIVGTDEPH